MDSRSFDRLARLLGGATDRRAGLKAALGAMIGVTGLADVAAADRRGQDRLGPDTGRKRRGKRCNPPCAPEQSCVKGACRCDNGGTVCGASCCLVGERCEGGACVPLPNPGTCIEFGEPCKNVGRPCCENLQCGSGQGGQDDVACWVRKTGACTSTAECVFGTECVDGICIAPVPPPPPPPGPTCTPTFPATANREANGDALKAAFAEAANNPGTVIVIDTGEYWLGDDPTDDGILWDHDNVTVTLQACPDADAVITQTGDNGGMFTVDGGTLRLVGPGLTIRGNTSECSGDLAKDYAVEVNGETARAELQDVRIIDIGRRAIQVYQGSVQVNGGVIRQVASPSNDLTCAAFSVDVPSAADVACSPNPTITGTVCEYNSSGASPGNGNCCSTWADN